MEKLSFGTSKTIKKREFIFKFGENSLKFCEDIFRKGVCINNLHQITLYLNYDCDSKKATLSFYFGNGSYCFRRFIKELKNKSKINIGTYFVEDFKNSVDYIKYSIIFQWKEDNVDNFLKFHNEN